MNHPKCNSNATFPNELSRRKHFPEKGAKTDHSTEI